MLSNRSTAVADNGRPAPRLESSSPKVARRSLAILRTKLSNFKIGRVHTETQLSSNASSPLSTRGSAVRGRERLQAAELAGSTSWDLHKAASLLCAPPRVDLARTPNSLFFPLRPPHWRPDCTEEPVTITEVTNAIPSRPKYHRESSFATLVADDLEDKVDEPKSDPDAEADALLSSRWSIYSSDSESDASSAYSFDLEPSPALPSAPHDIRWTTGGSDSTQVDDCEPLRPESPLAGIFDYYSSASTDSLAESGYFPRYVADVAQDSDDDVDPAVYIQPSHTPAPFPLYNVFICPTSPLFAPEVKARRHSGLV